MITLVFEVSVWKSGLSCSIKVSEQKVEGVLDAIQSDYNGSQSVNSKARSVLILRDSTAQAETPCVGERV